MKDIENKITNIKPTLTKDAKQALDEHFLASSKASLDNRRTQAKKLSWNSAPWEVKFLSPVAALASIVLAVALIAPALSDPESTSDLVVAQAPETEPNSGADGTVLNKTGDADLDASIPSDLPVEIPPTAVSPDQERLVAKTAFITLETDKAEETGLKSSEVADLLDGFVLNSTVSSKQGTATLLIPSSKLSEALSKLSQLGKVLDRGQTTQDVTAQSLSIDDSIEELESVRSSLLKELARAKNKIERQALQLELEQNKQIILSYQEQARALKEQVDYSQINVIIQSPTAKASDDGLTPSNSIADGLNVLEIVGSIILLLLVALAPIWILIASWLVYKKLQPKE